MTGDEAKVALIYAHHLLCRNASGPVGAAGCTCMAMLQKDFKHYRKLEEVTRTAVEELAKWNSHKVVEDCWYSCPMTEEEYCGGDKFKKCNCGKVEKDEILERVRAALEIDYSA